MIVAITFIACVAQILCQEADWSYFDVGSTVDSIAARQIIKKFPFTHYWDVSKGVFRTGILANDIIEEFPEFLTQVDIKVVHQGKIKTKQNTSTVDISTVLMYTMRAIQYLSETYESLHLELSTILNQRHLAIIEQSGSIEIWKSLDALADTQCKRKINQNKIKTTSRLLDIIAGNKLHLTNLTYHRKKIMMTVKNDQHEELMSSETASGHTIAAVTKFKFRNLSSLATEYALKEQSQQSAEAAQRHLHQLQHTTHGVEDIRATVHFRFHEESRKFREDEARHVHLLRIDSESRRAGLLLLVQTVCGQFARQVGLLLQDCTVIRSIALAVCGGLSVVLACLELFRLAHRVLLGDSLLARYSAAAPARTHTATVHCVNQRLVGKFSDHAINLLVDQDSAAKLLRLVRVLSQMGATGGLPHVLLSGPAGCGKSTAALLVVACCGVKTVHLCGADLAALGHLAGHKLKTLFADLRQCVEPCLVVIDDADDMLLFRIAKERREQWSVDCYYTLLAEMRQNSGRLAVLLTVSSTDANLSSCGIHCDPLLDRIDEVVSLRRPHTQERQDCLLLGLLSYMPEFLSPVEIRLLKIFGELVDVDLAQACRRDLMSHDSDWCLAACVRVAADVSEGWSHRQLLKFLSGVRVAVLGSDRIVLTQALWMHELQCSVTSHKLQSF